MRGRKPTLEPHALTEVDQDNRKAICSLCGPTKIRSRGRGRFLCVRKIFHEQIRFKYNKDLEWYDRRLIELGNRCACCGGEPGPKGLFIDHDHKTGEVRDLVCEGCNFMIGHAQDNPDRLRAGAEYLERRS
jgi:hypothetical protein